MGFYSQLETSLRQTCDLIFPDLSPANIIFSQQDGPEPKGTYIDIDIISLDQIGLSSTSTLTNVAEELTIDTEYEALVRFIFTGRDSDTFATEFNLALDNVFYWEQIRAKNLGIMRKAKVQRIPDKRETTIIKRFSLDVTFSFVAEVMQKVPVVDRIEITNLILGDTFII